MTKRDHDPKLIDFPTPPRRLPRGTWIKIVLLAVVVDLVVRLALHVVGR